MAEWVGVITNAGKNLLSSWVQGGTLTLTRAAAGTGTVSAPSLMAQTALVDERQEASIVNARETAAGRRVKLQVAASSASYNLNQMGIWGSVDGGTTSVMLAIVQTASAVPIPTSQEQPEFIFSLYVTLFIDNRGTVELTVDPSALVTQSTLAEAVGAHDADTDAHSDIRSGISSLNESKVDISGGSVKTTKVSDNYGVLGTAGADVSTQNLIDAIANKVKNQLAASFGQPNASTGNSAFNLYDSDGDLLFGSQLQLASAANYLRVARSIQTNLGSTSAVDFDGSANVTPGVTGTLPVAHGGTGATSAANARTNLGAASTAVATTAANGLLPKLGGGTANFLRADGSWAAPPNTTYGVATTAANGLLLKLAGGTAKYMRADGSWATPPDTNTTYAVMTGASTSAAGAAGLAPAPAKGAATRYLRSDGTWQVPPDTNTTYAVSTTAAAGLAPKLGGGTANFLRADGSWAAPPNTTYGVATTAANGLLRKLNGSTANYMRGDGTWQTPPNTTYGAATTAAAGLMPAADKVKLNGIATGATANSIAYVSPTIPTTAASIAASAWKTIATYSSLAVGKYIFATSVNFQGPGSAIDVTISVGTSTNAGNISRQSICATGSNMYSVTLANVANVAAGANFYVTIWSSKAITTSDIRAAAIKVV